MKKAILVLACGCFSGQAIYAQPLTTITGKRLYEHHSPSIAGPSGANGFQSGYDFLNHAYVYSFDVNTFGPYTDGTDTTIDIVEHNGPYGTGGPFGFTSGVSSIWQGDIKGNGVTKWMEAPTGFSFAGISSVTEIKDAYDAAIATQAIDAVENNKVYLGRIRNSGLYVAIRSYNVSNGAGNNDTYFDFDYKYGISSTAVRHVEQQRALSIYPNPGRDIVMLHNTLKQGLTTKIVSVTGQEMRSLSLAGNEVQRSDISDLPNGLYLIACVTEDGIRYVHKFMKY